jgi:hypothetical protein
VTTTEESVLAARPDFRSTLPSDCCGSSCGRQCGATGSLNQMLLSGRNMTGVPAITHLPSHDCEGPGYSAIEMWHSPLVMWPSLLVVMTQDPLPAAHSVSLRAVFST